MTGNLEYLKSLKVNQIDQICTGMLSRKHENVILFTKLTPRRHNFDLADYDKPQPYSDFKLNDWMRSLPNRMALDCMIVGEIQRVSVMTETTIFKKTRRIR